MTQSQSMNNSGSDVCESVVALMQEIELSVAIIDEKRMKQWWKSTATMSGSF